MASFSEDLAKLIEDALAKNSSSNNDNKAALVGGTAAAFKAQQMADLKAADLARKSGESVKPTSQALTTRGAGGSGSGALQIGEGTSAGNQLAQRAGGELTEYEARNMRNVTPRSGAGVGAISSGAAVMNPVAAGGATLLATSPQLGVGDYVTTEDDVRNMRVKTPDELAAMGSGADTLNRLLAGVERDKAIAPFMKEVNSAAGPISAPEITDRKAMQSATKRYTVLDMKKVEPVDMSKAEQLFKTTHGSAFDPKSSMDKRKMEEITGLLSKAGSDKLTPNQFALKIYRSHK